MSEVVNLNGGKGVCWESGEALKHALAHMFEMIIKGVFKRESEKMISISRTKTFDFPIPIEFNEKLDNLRFF
jgi:hypothetical protein